MNDIAVLLIGWLSEAAARWCSTGFGRGDGTCGTLGGRSGDDGGVPPLASSCRRRALAVLLLLLLPPSMLLLPPPSKLLELLPAYFRPLAVWTAGAYVRNQLFHVRPEVPLLKRIQHSSAAYM